MPFLVRWNVSDSSATIRCEHVVESKILPDHVRLVGVRGISDPEHPDLAVHSMEVRKLDVEYLTEGLIADDKANDDVEPPNAPNEQEKEEKPEPKKRRVRKKKQ